MQNSLPVSHLLCFLNILGKIQLQTKNCARWTQLCYFSSFTLPLVTAIHFYRVIPLQTLQTRTGQKVAWKQGDILLLISTKNFSPLSVTQQSTLQSRHRGTCSLSPLVGLCADLCIVWDFLCNKYQNYPKQTRKQIRSLKICTAQQTLFDLQQHSESHNIRGQTSCVLKNKNKNLLSKVLTVCIKGTKLEKRCA